MRVAVVGANGQLGTDVVRAFRDAGDEVFALTHQDIEITDLDSVCRMLDPLEPQILVNTAAMHHVETCEHEPERAFAVNALGPRNLARAARHLKAVLVHISTDYVFDGCKASPYQETDLPRPLNVYGNTKLAGEYFVRCTLDEHFVLRTSALYGDSPCRGKGGLNFVELMLKLAQERRELRVVDSEFVTPTYTLELAKQITVLSRTQSFGLYHATAEGGTSWFAFAQAVLAGRGDTVGLSPAAPGEFPAKVARPAYSVLDNAALKKIGMNVFQEWQSGLLEYLSSMSMRDRVQAQ